MKKYSHIIALEDVVEDDIVFLRKGERYPITGFDYKSLLYYVELGLDEEGMLPDEISVNPLDNRIRFIEKE